MRAMMLVFLLLVLAAPGRADNSVRSDDGQIIPGARIGPARLGMSEDEIEAINGETNCPVEAIFDPSGSAVHLVTSWGGSCRVSGEVQVGVSGAPTVDPFGRLPSPARRPRTLGHAPKSGNLPISYARHVGMLTVEALAREAQDTAVWMNDAQAQVEVTKITLPLCHVRSLHAAAGTMV